jgi:hypothetical protein
MKSVPNGLTAEHLRHKARRSAMLRNPRYRSRLRRAHDQVELLWTPNRRAYTGAMPAIAHAPLAPRAWVRPHTSRISRSILLACLGHDQHRRAKIKRRLLASSSTFVYPPCSPTNPVPSAPVSRRTVGLTAARWRLARAVALSITGPAWRTISGARLREDRCGPACSLKKSAGAVFGVLTDPAEGHTGSHDLLP